MPYQEFLFGPVLSRRLSVSLGICPIPYGHCNLSCIYCYLGRTQSLTNTREYYFNVDDIIKNLQSFLSLNPDIDVISIVGDGEPTLYSGLGELIRRIRDITDYPVAVITNGALICDVQVESDLMEADLILPSLDAFDEVSFKKINRPHGTLSFEEMIHCLQNFSLKYEGYLWMETMLIQGVNDDDESLYKLKAIFDTIQYQKLYINIPIRMTAEQDVNIPSDITLTHAFNILGGFTLELMSKELLDYDVRDHVSALKKIIDYFPLNELEVKTILRSRDCKDIKSVLEKLEDEETINIIRYKRFRSYHLKNIY